MLTPNIEQEILEATRLFHSKVMGRGGRVILRYDSLADVVPGELAHLRAHDLDSNSDHNPFTGATENNFLSFDSSGLIKDSGSSSTTFEASGAISGHLIAYDHSLIGKQSTGAKLYLYNNFSGGI